MSSLPRNRPEKFYDLVVQVAIIRPGPIVGKMMHPYMRRRQRQEEVTYPHPSLESTLKRTLGVPLFQEQLLRMAMVVANFTGSEAEELRRAVGMRRSWERMKKLEGRLRDGMTANGLNTETQETIIQNISSFALYGFPESHAASFALIAYASAYIKVKYLAAFTCAMMNNQPMGFYSPAVIIEDARRHGLRVKPIDIQVSDWPCTIEHEDDRSLSLRLGLGYVRGLRSQCVEAVVRARGMGLFKSVDDLVIRAPQLNRKELGLLANVGALNSLDGVEHRRDALWQIERAGKPEGPLLMQQSELLREEDSGIPLQTMSAEERLVADYAVSSVTTGPHPMAFRRAELSRRGYLRAADLAQRAHGSYVRTAGLAIVKQRPGTASGVVFLSVADETGIFNVFVAPDFFEKNRRLITTAKFLAVEGPIQKEGPIIHVMAKSFKELSLESQAGRLQVTSHDFH
jgi:error-prone DNA polymerase